MPEEIRHADGRIEHPSVRSEPTDASLRWVLGLIVAAALFGVFLNLMVSWFYHNYRDTLAAERKSRFALAPTPSLAFPPEPRLEQLDRMANLKTSNVYLRQKAKWDFLDSYGPTEEKGFIHIPIDQAMKLLANKLPARDDAVAAAGISAARTIGLLSPPGPGPLFALAAFFPGRADAEQAALTWRQNGLVDGGEPNSGRMFNRRKPRWFGP